MGPSVFPAAANARASEYGSVTSAPNPEVAPPEDASRAAAAWAAFSSMSRTATLPPAFMMAMPPASPMPPAPPVMIVVVSARLMVAPFLSRGWYPGCGHLLFPSHA